MAISVELYTIDHVIRGLLETAGERLSDILNIKTESAVHLRNVEVTRILNVGKAPPLRLSLVRLEKDSVLFGIPVAERDITQKSLYRRAARQSYEILVFLPNFELRGFIHLTERLDLRRVLVVRPEDYVPLTDATATFVLHPQVVMRAATVVFNKRHVALISEPNPTGEAGTPPAQAGQAAS